MGNSSILIDLDDPRTAKIADAISNKTCKKIIALLAEEELSESDIGKKLSIPLNTVGYNIKKLLSADLIVKSKKYFWSVKGKKILIYKVAKKRIIISPSSGIRGVLPVAFISGLIALGAGLFVNRQTFVNSAMDVSSMKSDEVSEVGREVVDGIITEGGSATGSVADSVVNAGSDVIVDTARGVVIDAGSNTPIVSDPITVTSAISGLQGVWPWFFFGAVFALILFLLLNSFKKS